MAAMKIKHMHTINVNVISEYQGPGLDGCIADPVYSGHQRPEMFGLN